MIVPHQFVDGLGVAGIGAAQLMLRGSVGAFFACSGYNKCFVPAVREKVQGLFDHLKVPKPLACAIRYGEFLGGLGLLAGALVPVAAAGLIMILAGAIVLDAWKADVVGKHPRNPADWVAKAFMEPELLLIVMLVVIMLIGGGQFSLDALI